MVKDHPTATPWPDNLAWIVARLRREPQQDFHEFLPDRGPPIRQAKSAAYEVLAGTVVMDDATWRAVEAMIQGSRYNLYRVVDPETDEPLNVTFVGKLQARRTTIKGESTTREIDLVVRIL